MTSKNKIIDYVPIGLMAAVIIFFAIKNETGVIRTLPTLITLFVQLLLVRANRYAFILGGANSVLYAICFFYEGLYFNAISAIAISVPMQFFSYFNWKKNSVGIVPKIRSLSPPKSLLVYSSIILTWLFLAIFIVPRVPAWSVLLGNDASVDIRYLYIDSLTFLLGIASTFMSAFLLIDSQYCQFISTTASLGLWMMKTQTNPQNINIFIISIYNFYMMLRTLFSWHKFKKTSENNTNFNINERGAK